jgi:integrase
MPKKANGEGTLTRHGDGWRLRWSMPDGTRKSRVVGKMTEAAAKRLLRQLIADAERSVSTDPVPTKNIRFDVLAKEYLAAREPLVAVSTYRCWVSLLNTTLLPTFGELPLDQITQRRVDIWWAYKATKPVLRRNAYFTLRSMMRLAVRWGYLAAWTVEIDGAGKDVAKPRPVYEIRDVDAVLVHLDPFYKPAIEVLLSGHVRLGELVALNAEDYDRKTGKITVTKQRTQHGLTTETKTRQHKTVRLLERGRVALDANPRRIGGPLFPGKRGERITRLGLRKAWVQAATATGLPNFHLHDLRHVGLSLVVEVAGIIVAQERAGHASATSTRRYLHTSERVHDEAVEKLDELVRRIS